MNYSNLRLNVWCGEARAHTVRQLMRISSHTLEFKDRKDGIDDSEYLAVCLSLAIGQHLERGLFLPFSYQQVRKPFLAILR